MKLRSWYRIPYWQNRAWAAQLHGFRFVVVDYFSELRYPSYGDPVETERGRELRRVINRDLHSIERLLQACGVSDRVTHRDHPLVGGRVTQNVPLLANIFQLHQLGGGEQDVLDLVDRATGNLESDRRNSMLRVLNPLYWFGRLLEFIADLPFVALGRIGYDRRRLEDSVGGRLVKAFLYALTIAASLITIAEFVGWGHFMRSLLRLR